MPLMDSDNEPDIDLNALKYCEENWKDTCRKRKPNKKGGE